MKRFYRIATVIIIALFSFSVIRPIIICNEIVQANGSVTVDGPVSSGAFIGNLTLPHTSGTGENRLLLVGVSWGRTMSSGSYRGISEISFNGVELELVIEYIQDPINCVAIYQYPGEAPQEILADIEITFSSVSINAVVGAINFAGVDLSDPFGARQTATGSDASNIALDIAAGSGHLVFDTISTESQSLVSDNSQSEQWNTIVLNGPNKLGAASTKTATSTTTMSWTGVIGHAWSMAAVAIRPAQQAIPSIGDFVWIDRDGDGIQDSDEIGLPEVVVDLYQDGGSTPYQSTVTDANGHYSFEDVPPGSYFLQFTHPTFDLIFTSQDQGPDDTIDSDVDSVGVTSVFSEFNNNFDAGVLAPQNPSLSETCGLDIALVIDTSSSVDANAYDQISAALTEFVELLLPGTRTQMALVQYASEAEVVQDWTSNPTSLSAAISTRHDNGNDANWDDALYEARNLFPSSRPDVPDLIIFITDSEPTAFGGHGEDQPLSNQAVSTAFSYAIPETFVAKGDDIRLLALNIGGANNTTYLSELIGPQISPAEPLSIAADIIETSISDLTSALQDLAGDMCGGTCTIHNIIDPVGNLDEDDWITEGAGLANWQYEVSIENGALSLAQDQDNPALTGTDGQAIVNFEITSTPATFDLQESLRSGWELLDVECFSNGILLSTPVLIDTTISGIPFSTNSAILSCYFYNHPTPSAVTLLSFTAKFEGDSVLLKWETASEIDNLGFNLYREDIQSGLKVKITPELIPSKSPGSIEGAQYDFSDEFVNFGEPYAYWLEAIDLSMRVKDVFGPAKPLWWQFFLPIFSISP